MGDEHLWMRVWLKTGGGGWGNPPISMTSTPSGTRYFFWGLRMQVP